MNKTFNGWCLGFFLCVLDSCFRPCIWKRYILIKFNTKYSYWEDCKLLYRMNRPWLFSLLGQSQNCLPLPQKIPLNCLSSWMTGQIEIPEQEDMSWMFTLMNGGHSGRIQISGRSNCWLHICFRSSTDTFLQPEWEEEHHQLYILIIKHQLIENHIAF